MAEIAIPLGKDARLFYGAPNGGITLTAQATAMQAAGNEISSIKDATITIEKDDVETTRRASHGWEDSREGIKRMSLSFDIFNIYDAGPEQVAIAILRETYLNGTYNGLQAVSGICLYAKSSLTADVDSEPGPQHIALGDGPCADFLVTKFERSESHGDAQSYSVECKMTQVHGRRPAWVAV